jgi:TonB family protein
MEAEFDICGLHHFTIPQDLSMSLRFSLIMIAALLTAAHADDNALPRVNLSKAHALPVYPEKARLAGQTGITVIAVHVNELGKPFELQTETSSGSEALDQAGIDAVRFWRFVPATRDGEDIAEWTAVGFRFDANGGAQIDVPADTKIAQGDRDRVICRKDAPKTGSIIDPAPVCLPKWQWAERDRKLNTRIWDRPQSQHSRGGVGPGGTSQ